MGHEWGTPASGLGHVAHRDLRDSPGDARRDPRARRRSEVVHCELDRDERLNVVSVLDGDWTEIEQPVYYSGEFDCRGEPAKMSGTTWIAERAYLIGMSITAHPASLEARALGVMLGDIRKTVDRSGWPVSFGWHAPLLERAVRNLPQRGETWTCRMYGPHDAERRPGLHHRSSVHPAEIAQALEDQLWEKRRRCVA